MKVKSIVFAIVLTTISWSSLFLWAQGTNPSLSGPQPSAASPSPGSATIENQMIAYEVLRQMAEQIAERVRANCNCGSVLLPDANSQSEIITAKAFDVSADALIDAYNAVANQAAPSIHPEAFAPTLSDVAALLTAIKSSASYSNQNFQPTTQSMITLLSITLNGKQIAVRTTNLPGDLNAGVHAVQEKVGEIEKAEKAAKERIHSDMAAEKAMLADLDKEFSALRTALGGASADGTVLAAIIKGKTLLQSSPYSLLTVSIDAAGGDTKVTHFFWRELIMPTPSPSYNGGAVISFLLTDSAGKFQDGDIYHYMYDFSKWKSPKVPGTFNRDSHLQRPSFPQ